MWITANYSFQTQNQQLPVYDILEYLAGGMTETEILEDFSSLTQDNFRAMLLL